MLQTFIWHNKAKQKDFELQLAGSCDKTIFCSWSWPGMIEEQNILLISLLHRAFDHENLIEAWHRVQCNASSQHNWLTVTHAMVTLRGWAVMPMLRIYPSNNHSQIFYWLQLQCWTCFRLPWHLIPDDWWCRVEVGTHYFETYNNINQI